MSHLTPVEAALLVALVIALVALVRALVRTIRTDGYGPIRTRTPWDTPHETL